MVAIYKHVRSLYGVGHDQNSVFQESLAKGHFGDIFLRGSAERERGKMKILENGIMNDIRWGYASGKSFFSLAGVYGVFDMLHKSPQAFGGIRSAESKAVIVAQDGKGGAYFLIQNHLVFFLTVAQVFYGINRAQRKIEIVGEEGDAVFLRLGVGSCDIHFYRHIG